MIISFSGKARAGKDTCADVLVNKFGFKKFNLADPIKTICSRVFDLPVNCFYDADLKDKIFDRTIKITSSHVDKLISEVSERGFTIDSAKELELFENCVGAEMISPRNILQFIGTDICRRIIDDEIWLTMFIQECNTFDGHVVCADARFPNERERIKRNGGLNVFVERPDLVSVDSHISENLLGEPGDYDVFVINDRSKQLMESDIESWWFTKSHRRI